MNSLVGFLLIALVCSTIANPTSSQDNSASAQDKNTSSPDKSSTSLDPLLEIDFIGNGKKLVDNLLKNLLKVGDELRITISTFTDGIHEQIRVFILALTEDANKLRDNVTVAIKTITERIDLAGYGVRACIEEKLPTAQEFYSTAIANSKQCADETIASLQSLVDQLADVAQEAVYVSEKAINDTNNCSGNLFAQGVCYGRVIIQTQLQSARIATQSAILTTRINFAMSTLPAALQVCTGSNILIAGSQASSVLSEMATCSLSAMLPSSAELKA
ncbi:unnamed protein product [Leptidea sinapis]|uniref:Protein TsetseEP domain-containing protein n=1 Tax=Leptidea sinapis TaxID=189913 RepID=A0A5E4PNQ4_9NEOP|nr:unnamed protein product [Leptidea sinapis]